MKSPGFKALRDYQKVRVQWINKCTIAIDNWTKECFGRVNTSLNYGWLAISWLWQDLLPFAVLSSFRIIANTGLKIVARQLSIYHVGFHLFVNSRLFVLKVGPLSISDVYSECGYSINSICTHRYEKCTTKCTSLWRAGDWLISISELFV